jgi:hypothetical protein
MKQAKVGTSFNNRSSDLLASTLLYSPEAPLRLTSFNALLFKHFSNGEMRLASVAHANVCYSPYSHFFTLRNRMM